MNIDERAIIPEIDIGQSDPYVPLCYAGDTKILLTLKQTLFSIIFPHLAAMFNDGLHYEYHLVGIVGPIPLLPSHPVHVIDDRLMRELKLLLYWLVILQITK